jgi:hypothetical protein
MADVNQITGTARVGRTGLGRALSFVKARAGAKTLFCKFCGLDLFSAAGGVRGYCSPACADRHCTRAATVAWFRVV